MSLQRYFIRDPPIMIVILCSDRIMPLFVLNIAGYQSVINFQIAPYRIAKIYEKICLQGNQLKLR